MIFGEKEIFAIECYHEPIDNNKNWVFGRMCLWCSGLQFGDITEPSCLLNVTEGFLRGFIETANQLEDIELNKQSDWELFKFLDKKIYGLNERTFEQVIEDAKKYRKFDFLTSSGESFETIKSFVVKNYNEYRLLISDRLEIFKSFRINSFFMENVVIEFLVWMESEKNIFKK